MIMSEIKLGIKTTDFCPFPQIRDIVTAVQALFLLLLLWYLESLLRSKVLQTIYGTS